MALGRNAPSSLLLGVTLGDLKCQGDIGFAEQPWVSGVNDSEPVQFLQREAVSVSHPDSNMDSERKVPNI